MPLTRIGHHDDWPTLGWEVVDWIEAYLCHGPGDVEGDPLLLDDEFVQVILDCYRIHPRNHARAGRRVVSRGSIWRAKGRAKSELAGALVCVEGAGGPVRFDGWDASGKPVGRPVRSPFIRCLATEEGQAGNTYDNVTVMLDHARERHPDVFAGVDIGKNTQASTRCYLPGGGEIRPSTASSAAKDGGKETFAVSDEIHLYYKPELRGMHAMVRRNLRKRKIAEPWMLETTTAFLPGQGSVAQDVWDAVRLTLDKSKRPPGGLYVNHREGFEVDDWADDDQILASLIEAYGAAAVWMDLARILSDDIRSPEATESDSRRYWLNQITPGSGKFFDLDRWNELGAERTVPDGELITFGFDGARWFDSTALIATDVVTGYQWVAGLWERPVELLDSDEWQVPEDEVTAAVAALFEHYQVWRGYCDPPHWKDTISGWAGKWDEKVVHEWWTTRDRAMAFALHNYRTAIATGEVSHDGSVGMARHIGNAFNRETRVKDDDGKPMGTIQKERPKSPLKIDAAVAGCLSWECRSEAIAAGATKTKKHKSYAF